MSSAPKRSEATAGVSRRGVVKAGAAAAVAVTVWSEPTIKGLARRPAYAAAGSAGIEGCVPTGEYRLDFDGSRSAIVYSDRPVEVVLTQVSEDKFQLQVTADGCICSFTNRGLLGSYISDQAAQESTGFIDELADGTQVICFKWETGSDAPITIAVKEELCYECKPR